MKHLLSLFLILFIAQPVCAQIMGSVSQQTYYDLENTIIKEVAPDTHIKNIKYWDTNYFFSNSYTPSFLLSNKELTRFFKPRRRAAAQAPEVPSVYNISFKTSSIKSVSLSHKKEVPRESFNAISVFENAKNADNLEQKINAALKLKSNNKGLALNLLDNIITTNPQCAHAYYLKGEIYYSLEQWESSIENYAKALQLNPSSTQSCLGIARILDRTNRELAQKYYQKADLMKERHE